MKKAFYTLVTYAFIFAPAIVRAQGGGQSGGGGTPGGGGTVGSGGSATLDNPLKFKTLGEFLLGAADAFLSIGVIVAVFGILYAGFLFVMAQGNEQKLQRAKSAFLWSVVGLAVIVGALVLVTAIQGTIAQIRG